MKEKLFNYEVIALVIASCLTSLGAVTLIQVLVSPPENNLARVWEYGGISSLLIGCISGSIFWLLRRLLNKN